MHSPSANITISVVFKAGSIDSFAMTVKQMATKWIFLFSAQHFAFSQCPVLEEAPAYAFQSVCGSAQQGNSPGALKWFCGLSLNNHFDKIDAGTHFLPQKISAIPSQVKCAPVFE